MTPDDPRHGTDAGYAAHHQHGQKACADCTWAHCVANERRRMTGVISKVSTVGPRRRVRALQALGWSKREIARQAGYSDKGSLSYMMRSDTMYKVTADRVNAVYERLSMIRPTGHVADRTRGWAARSGWPPPLAWDNIDDPDEQPAGQRFAYAADYDCNEIVDEATVLRILAGEKLRSNQAERDEIMRRWLALGNSERSLCVRLGWKDGRYGRTAA